MAEVYIIRAGVQIRVTDGAILAPGGDVPVDNLLPSDTLKPSDTLLPKG